MSIQELTDKLREIGLNHKDIKSYYIGNTWDMSVSKSSDTYPAIWQELPILVTYNSNGQKEYTFSIDILMLAKQDNVDDELNKISQCEEIADDILQAYKLYIKSLTVTSATALSVKNINSDMAVGIRLDIKFITNRTCSITSRFNREMTRG